MGCGRWSTTVLLSLFSILSIFQSSCSLFQFAYSILDSQPDVTSHPLVGPALRVADQLLTWDQEGEMARGPHVRVLFEADVTKLASSYLCMQNCGTTAIRYCWEVLLHNNTCLYTAFFGRVATSNLASAT